MTNGRSFFKGMCLIILFLAGLYPGFGQSDEDIKDAPVTINLKHKSLKEVFGYLSIQYGIAIGFEESALDAEHNDFDFIPNLPYSDPTRPMVTSGFAPIKNHWFTLNFSNERLAVVLDHVVAQMQNYQWEINDGIVNIFPTRGRDERLKKLLDLQIADFRLDRPAPIFSVRNKLLELPELVAFMKENKIRSSKVKGDFNFTDRKLNVDLRFENLKLKNLLNQITKIKRGGWILKKNDLFDSKEFFYFDIDI